MKNRILRFAIRTITSATILISTQAIGETLSLDPSGYNEITFKKVKPTIYTYANGTLKGDVSGSSSALLRSFSKIRVVKGMSFEWKLEGKLNTTSKSEKTKEGDDFPLRVGLIVSGKAPWIPFFAPAWIDAVKSHLKLPTNLMSYLVFGAFAKGGEKWESPYSDSIMHTAITSSAPSVDGWRKVDTTFPPTEIVGIWLMADGDNSKSAFVTSLRNADLR